MRVLLSAVLLLVCGVVHGWVNGGPQGGAAEACFANKAEWDTNPSHYGYVNIYCVDKPEIKTVELHGESIFQLGVDRRIVSYQYGARCVDNPVEIGKFSNVSLGSGGARCRQGCVQQFSCVSPDACVVTINQNFSGGPVPPIVTGLGKMTWTGDICHDDGDHPSDPSPGENNICSPDPTFCMVLPPDPKACKGDACVAIPVPSPGNCAVGSTDVLCGATQPDKGPSPPDPPIVWTEISPGIEIPPNPEGIMTITIMSADGNTQTTIIRDYPIPGSDGEPPPDDGEPPPGRHPGTCDVATDPAHCGQPDSSGGGSSGGVNNNGGSGTCVPSAANNYCAGHSGNGQGHDESGACDPATDPYKCKPGNNAGGGATCTAAPMCSGDQALCAILFQQWQSKCSTESLRAGRAATDADLGAAPEPGDVWAPESGGEGDDELDGAGWLGGGDCVRLPTLSLFGRAVDLSQVIPCDALAILATLILLGGYAQAAYIIGKG